MINNLIDNDKYILLGIAFMACLLLLVFGAKKKTKHDFNWDKAKKLHKKLNTEFTGQGFEARIFAYLRKVDPFVFEELLLYAYKLKGYQVIRNKKYTGDGGIDGKVIAPNGTKYLIQAKRYSSHINPAHVSEFENLVQKSRWSDSGLFIHTGKTGGKSWESAAIIEIISGKRLIEILIQ